MFRLEYSSGDPLLLPPDLSIVIGRGDQCDLQLDDPSASRVHCRVIAQGGKVTLTDEGSRWGTFVNGQQVQQCDLRPGDRVTVGETVLKLGLQGDPHGTTLARKSELFRPDIIATDVPQFTNDLSVSDAVIPDELADSSPGNAERPREVRSGRPALPDLQVPKPLSEADLLGSTFHRYRILQTIAITSSGMVFRAREGTSERTLALKIFQPHFFADVTAEQRFERATRTMFDQRHPGIVQLYNAGKKDGYCFTASQLIEGQSAVDMIRRIGVAGMLDPPVVLQIAVDLCEALRFAEAREVVHRNIKPSNILIRESDRAALLNDLILAKASTVSGAEQLTQAGDILGDISYLSPEQLGSGHSVDCRSDIYQLGATLYALLTGRPPLEGGTSAQTMTKVLTAMPTPVQQLHLAVPPQFDTVVLKMLSKNPRDRFQNAADLAAALRKVCAETDQQNIKPRCADPEKSWGGALDGLL